MIDARCLARALDSASGRGTHDVPETDLMLARRLLDARRAQQQAPACPPAVRARARALRDLLERRPSFLARLVQDSWSAPAPARRGPAPSHTSHTSRTMRYATNGHWLDLQVLRRPDGTHRLHFVIVSPERPQRAQIRELPSMRAIEVPLDDLCGGHVDLAADTRHVVVRIFDGSNELLRTPDIELG